MSPSRSDGRVSFQVEVVPRVKSEEDRAVRHTPVLPRECLALLAPPEGDEAPVLVDGTCGEGGHSALFLAAFPRLRVIALDADAAIVEKARTRLAPFAARVELRHCWSGDFFRATEDSYSRILLDLGVSMYHYEAAARGFSFRRDEPLDMRIDVTRGRTAAEIIAGESEKRIADILYYNAEERHSRRIAAAIVAARRQSPVRTSGALAEIVAAACAGACAGARGKIHPATKTFQALRIEVNGELKKLPTLLEAAFACLKSGGRLGVITFHSLEDRLVKQAFRAFAESGAGLLATKKPLSCSREEAARNPPSRSAKLRVIERMRMAGER